MVMKLFLAGSCLISYNAFEPGSINCNLKMGAVCLSPVTFSAKLAQIQIKVIQCKVEVFDPRSLDVAV